MNRSIGEIESQVKTAARGAGYANGLAEEAAKAVGWLAGFDGSKACAAFASLLSERAAGDIAEFDAAFVGNALHAKFEPLCPITAGAAISDWADGAEDPALETGAVAHPVLLVPFVAAIARSHTLTLSLEADGFRAVTNGTALSTRGAAPARATSVVIQPASNVLDPLDKQTRADIPGALWSVLKRFAHHTYAPSTEESRRLGAGSGETDQD
ncbi:MAG: DUF3726 domain-containing protein [Rhodobacteraceae bacterium]|nr:DUF3726 domain-containing protein [Paracoccaceae bacterium]